MRLRKIFFYIFFILITVFFGIYTSLWNGFELGWLNYLIPNLSFLVIFLLIKYDDLAYIYAGVVGIFIDLFTPSIHAPVFIRYLFLVLILHYLVDYVFTNKSLYAAIILVFLAQLLDLVLYYILTFLGSLVFEQITFFTFSLEYIFFRLLFNVLLIVLLFIVFTVFSKVFLIRVNYYRK